PSHALALHDALPISFPVDAVQAAAGDADLRDRRAVLWSGWAQAKWNDRAFYRDNPYLSNEAAQWLVRTGVRALGVDFAVDGGPPKPPGQPKYPVHLITLGADVCLIENLINLNRSQEHTSELQSRVDLVCRLAAGKQTGRSGVPYT